MQLIDPFDGVEDLQVMAPLPESPAEQAGISPGDSIVAIDDIDVAYSHMTPDEAIAILRGPEGSFVKLGVVSATAKKQHPVELKRRPLHIKPLKSEIIESEYGRFGYIRIHFFISSAREDMVGGFPIGSLPATCFRCFSTTSGSYRALSFPLHFYSLATDTNGAGDDGIWRGWNRRRCKKLPRRSVPGSIGHGFYVLREARDGARLYTRCKW